MSEPGHDDDAEERVWQDALDALLLKGATHAEAIEGANLILSAYRRRAAPPANCTQGSGKAA